VKVLLLGGEGQVGHELRGPLATFCDVLAPTRREHDLADLDATRELLARVRPDLVINTVAWNEVDKAESERAGAMRLNCEAVALLGEEAKKQRFALITYSTDFVFDGEGDRPYREDDATHPLSAYGESKLAGERALHELDAPALVFRTAWVWSLRRKSFVSAIVNAAKTREVMKVVVDQVGSPTWARDLAVATALVARDMRDPFAFAAAKRGVYHLAGSGIATRHELACAAIDLVPDRIVKTIEAVPSTAFPAPARRPRHAPLAGDKARRALGVALPDWRDAVRRAFADGLAR
jgi:dTDP-4-dehydrorhamnose reductase